MNRHDIIRHIAKALGKAAVFSKLDLLKGYFQVPVTASDVVYIDVILIFSENEHDHQEHLQTVLCVLQENELVARQDKCVFGGSSVEFLGHVINTEGIQPTQNKVKVITNYPTPTIIKDLKAFLGLVNFYGRFILMASHIMPPPPQPSPGW